MRKKVIRSICIICLLAVLFAGIPAATAHGYPTNYPNTWENTENQARDIAKIAESQVGYKESGYNHTKYNVWMFGSDVSQPWCTSFVAWCANQAGVSTSVIPKVARAASMRSGISSFYSPGQGTPKVGDIVFFSYYRNGKISHSGIVTGYSNGTITLVHGNWGNSVCYGTVQWKSGAKVSNSQYVVGLARPNYPPEPKKYTVSYDANGGIGAPAPQTKKQWKKLELNTIVPERPFYDFLGWATEPDAQQAQIRPGDLYTADSDVRYYAIWRRIPVAVIYEDGVTEENLTQEFKEEETPATLGDIPERDGCRFLGWRDEVTGKVYQPSQEIEISSETITLEALWESSIVYETNDGTRGGTVQTHLCGAGERIQSFYPEKDGALFCGWSDEAGTVYHPGDTIPDDWTQKTLTAQWTQTEEDAAVVLYAAGAQESAQVLLCAGDGDTYPIGSWIPQKDGCVFAGWADADGTVYQPGDQVPAGAALTVLTAQWETEITFDPQNGTDGVFTQTYPVSQTARIPEEIPEKDGAVFCGWQTESEKICHPGDLITADLDGAKLTAQWRSTTQYRFGWNKINGSWYFIGEDGAMCSGWKQIGGKWYHFDDLGVMQTGWIRLNGDWFFLNSDGSMRTGWVKSGGKWYYLVSSGQMKIGWVRVSGKWYYLSRSGAMVTGWFEAGGKWYYANGSGVMQTNRWIGDYYVQSDGSMATNRWIGRYHVNRYGKWDKTR